MSLSKKKQNERNYVEKMTLFILLPVSILILSTLLLILLLSPYSKYFFSRQSNHNLYILHCLSIVRRFYVLNISYYIYICVCVCVYVCVHIYIYIYIVSVKCWCSFIYLSCYFRFCLLRLLLSHFFQY